MDGFGIDLDISGFSPQKKKILEDFIKLFDKLNKYDKMKVNPIALDGLLAFNNSVKQTSVLLDEVNSKLKIMKTSGDGVSESQKRQASSTNEVRTKYEQLNDTLKRQELIYANLVLAQGKTSVAAKAAARDLSNTVAEVKRVDKALESAGAGGATAFGRSLTRGLSTLRTIAYILPGIGIAGIFNLAFSAIGSAVDAMDLFENKSLKVAAAQIQLNAAFKDFNEILKSIEATYSTTLGSYQVGKDLLTLTEAQNKSSLTKLGIEKELIRLSALKNQEQAELNGGFKREEELRGKMIQAEIEYYDAQKPTGITKYDAFGHPDGFEKADPKYLEAAKSNLERAEFEYNKVKKINEDRANSLNAYDAKILQIKDVTDEARRKAVLEMEKFEVDSTKRKNDAILSDDRTTEAERLRAIENIRRADVKLAEANLAYTKSRPDFKNYDAVTDVNGIISLKENGITEEGKTAIEAANKAVSDAKSSANQKSEKVQIEFYQRLIKAKSEIDKDEIEKDAIINEKIFNNTKNSLDKRLEAYAKYVVQKQTLQDIEYQRDIQKGAIGPGGKTNLTDTEQLALLSNKRTLQANLASDAEKKVYDIVSTSIEERRKLIIAANREEEENNQKAYTKALTTLNKSLEDKKISVTKYNEARKEIDHKYRLQFLDAAIKDDNTEIVRLVDEAQRLEDAKYAAQDKKNTTGALLSNAKRNGGDVSGAQNNYDKAVGELNAINDAILRSNQDLQVALKSLDDDELKRAKEKYDALSELEKKHLKDKLQALHIFEEIEKRLYHAVKDAGDKTYEDRIKRVEQNQKTVDDQYGYEIDAIEKSSLSQKEKTALSIQLNQQKIESDKAAAVEEKRLRHEKAVFDKKLAMVHIVLSTAESVAEALTAGIGTGEALAIERAALGAAELAIAAATEVPSYGEGTPEGGHPGGKARYGESGWEIVKKPYQSPYLVMSETVSYLPKGTEVIPIKESPVFGEARGDDGWAQTMYLAKMYKKSKQEVKNVINNKIFVDTTFLTYKKQILGN